MRFLSRYWHYGLSLLLISVTASLLVLTSQDHENTETPSPEVEHAKEQPAPEASTPEQPPEEQAVEALKTEAPTEAPSEDPVLPAQSSQELEEQPEMEGIHSETAKGEETAQEDAAESNTEEQPIAFDEQFFEPYSDGKLMPKIDPQPDPSWVRFGSEAQQVTQGTDLSGNSESTKKQSLVLTELGLDSDLVRQAHSLLPKAVTFALFSSTGLEQSEIDLMIQEGREIVIMVPMEPKNYPEQDPGFNALLTTLNPDENIRRLQYHLSRFQGYVGILPFMGHHFSASTPDFMPVLKELSRRKVAYLEPFSFSLKSQAHATQTHTTQALFTTKASSHYGDLIQPGQLLEALFKSTAYDNKNRPMVISVTATPQNIHTLRLYCTKLLEGGFGEVTLLPLSKSLRSSRTLRDHAKTDIPKSGDVKDTAIAQDSAGSHEQEQ